MELHEFMVPEVIHDVPSLDFASSVATQPSDLFVGMNRSEGRILVSGEVYDLHNDDDWKKPILEGGKNQRRIVILDPPFSKISKTIYVDLEDARYVPRELVFGQDFNVFQYNRRRGDRTSVLWRLASYFTSDESLGHRPQVDFSDEPTFEDKIPKLFWRGGVSGSRWLSPGERKGAGKINLRTVVNPAIWKNNSRFQLVFGRAESPLIDAKFTGNTVDRFVHDYLRNEQFFGGTVSPRKMVNYRYLFCPAGNDVASSLYWIIGTQSVAVKEDVEYEVWPDFYLKPWVHFVPVSKGLADLEEKLDYCERNVSLTKRIVENANAAYWQIRDSKVWSEQSYKALDRMKLLRD
mgnify:CR=1 FL=1